MKKLLLFSCLHIGFITSYGQSTSWQQRADHSIKVTLNDKEKTLDGFSHITYTNNSPDTLREILFHLWPNAYKNDRTAFTDQQLENGSTEFYFSSEDKRGYINRLAFTVDGLSAILADDPQHQDIGRLILPKPLAPHSSTIIETPFHVKLPYFFSRSGWKGDAFHITQWFPKPAVYDQAGWHAIPYLDQGEFYSDFGKYDVEIKTPASMLVAATGVLTDQREESGMTLRHYVQDSIIDFAWFADPTYRKLEDTMLLGNRVIHLNVFFHEKNSKGWANAIMYMKRSLRSKSELLGEYPYNVATVVENESGNGGMEYPTITLVTFTPNERMLEYVINHELGHNWFMGMLASNERDHPWMDEGMNSYYDRRYQQTYYPSAPLSYFGFKNSFIQKREPLHPEDMVLATQVVRHIDQPVTTRSYDFNAVNYNVVAYTKTAQWMEELERQMGQERFDRFMHSYFSSYKFSHPQPADFRALAEKQAGKDLTPLFNKLDSKGAVTPAQQKHIRFASFFNVKESDKYHYISVLPAIGYNHYDRFMIGAMVHNFNLPPSTFQFYAIPFYSTGAKDIRGSAGVRYDLYTGNKGARFTIGVNGSSYTVDDFKDSTGKRNMQPYRKIVPSLTYHFAPSSARNEVRMSIQATSFLIQETGISFSTDPVTGGDVITYPTSDRYVNRLRFQLENNRTLYPYDLEVQADQGKGFVRAGITANYFFNFPTGGGLALRAFAGKFFYTVEKTFLNQYATDRYHLTLSGRRGYEDYTYDNYFIGRNEFEGLGSQQMMIRDGGFKVSTDLLSNKIGKTDNWLSAINMNTDIPDAVNIFRLFPFKVPVKIFADMGTFAEAWKKDAPTGKIVYDAGLQISVFKNMLNVYFPLLYSKAFDDYYKSTFTEKRFSKKISFSINFNTKALRKLAPKGLF